MEHFELTAPANYLERWEQAPGIHLSQTNGQITIQGKSRSDGESVFTFMRLE